MPKLNDLTGKRFGRLVVVGRISRYSNRVHWKCKCDCGRTTVVRASNLSSHAIVSCGCYHTQELAFRLTTHGLSRSPEYRIWRGLISRCNNRRNAVFTHYGGRGIKVCKRWLKFENFYVDMGNRPSRRHSIDRIDNNGNYTPKNCRWATRKQQANNARSNHRLRHNGKSMTISQWSDETGISRSAIHGRIKMGWGVARLLSTPSIRSGS